MIFFFWYDVLTLMMKPQGQILVFFVSYGLTQTTTSGPASMLHLIVRLFIILSQDKREDLKLTMGIRRGWGQNPGFHDCEPSTLPRELFRYLLQRVEDRYDQSLNGVIKDLDADTRASE